MSEKRGSRVWPIVAGVVALVVLYVASVGPAVYCVQRRWLSMNITVPFYRPLQWGVENSLVIHDAFKAYDRWWTELANSHSTNARPPHAW